MALFRPTLGELSGSIGNTTFAHNKGGAYSRRRSVPTNPNTAPQQVVRIQLAQLSAAWAALTVTQQADWTTWAEGHPTPNPLGTPRIRSGHQAFVGLNIRVLQMALATVNEPPITNTPPGINTPGIVWTSPAAVVVTFTPVIPTGSCLFLWSSLPGSLGRSPNFRQARLVAISAVDQTSPWTAASRITALTGQQATLWVTVVDANGQASPPTSNKTIVA